MFKEFSVLASINKEMDISRLNVHKLNETSNFNLKETQHIHTSMRYSNQDGEDKEYQKPTAVKVEKVLRASPVKSPLSKLEKPVKPKKELRSTFYIHRTKIDFQSLQVVGTGHDLKSNEAMQQTSFE